MRIGVLGDTHDRLANVERAVELLRAAGVERVVHTGDITRPGTLERFAALGVPLVGVFGNNDHDRAGLAAAGTRLGFELSAGERRLAWGERELVVIHDLELLAAGAAAGCDLVLHGHTHRPACERQGTQVIFNPGDCASSGPGRNAVGVVDLRTLAFEHLRF